MSYVIGIDTGGTFTDCVVVDSQGRVTTAKAPTTPRYLSEGVFAAVEKAAQDLGLSLKELMKRTTVFCHASTVGTNALLTRSGAKTGLITTQGFEDIILMMRTRGRFAGLPEEEIKHVVKTRKPPPLVPRGLIRGVPERVDYQGRILVPLDLEAARQAVKELLAEGVEAIAISLLWSFVNPAHEQQLKEIVARMAPDLFVTVSSELAPRLGEYERTATTVMNAYLGPVNAKYVGELAERLKGSGLEKGLLYAQGYGGCVPPETAMYRPVNGISSGPASGVIASKFLGQMLGYSNIITTDVGGTSFDVGLIYGGEVALERHPVVNQYDLFVPLVQVKSIGAGGGSIAHVETGTGVLKVGPASAGAAPGPACYGRGGVLPTVTDANVVSGIINPDYFLGGAIKLHKKKAYSAVKTVADQMGITPLEAAGAIFDVANGYMSDLVRLVTIGSGYDPRNCVLLAYGGAGPVHASFYGRQAREIVVPPTASVHSALGTVVSEVLHVYEMSDPVNMPADPARIARHFQDLEEKGLDELRREGFGKHEASIERFIDMRYSRQVHELRVRIDPGEITLPSLEAAVEKFEELYQASYGSGAAYREAGVQMVNYLVYTHVAMGKPVFPRRRLKSANPGSALKGQRQVFLRKWHGPVEARVYERDLLEPGNLIPGMAIIEARDTTILVDRDQEAHIDEYLNVRLRPFGENQTSSA